jgi:type I restriction enzyme S subunit
LPALLVQRVARIRARSHANADFIALVLASREFQEYLEADLTGVSVPHISERQIGSFPTPELGRSEQERIATEATEDLKRLEALSLQIASAIALLQERRAALITAAVTGKIDVRNYAADQAEAV